MFSDFLLTVDFDHTLTGPDSSIPARNIEAIEYFIANGGIFTVNTGRSYVSFREHLDAVPINGPLLLLNGSAVWEDGQFYDVRNIHMDIWPGLVRLREKFPEVDLELQSPDMHYLIDPQPTYAQRYLKNCRPHRILELKPQTLDFVKIGVYGDPRDPADHMDRVQEFLTEEYGAQLEILRADSWIINIHAKGVSKGNAARALQKKLGRKILICVGDAENDVSMLRGADHGFCPADGAVADQFPNVCPCGDGAVADVIYNSLPAILKR